jgi:hypothetical protein
MRAFSESHELAIHLDAADSVATIVHEIGHQMENQMSTDLWLDLQRLLHGRHQTAVAAHQPNQLVRIYEGNDQEVAYRAEMPATGPYSAKAYDGPGATEVMSMSMEFLSQPGTTKRLIACDPLQAAIVLRRIAQQDFLSHVPVHLRNLLPS